MLLDVGLPVLPCLVLVVSRLGRPGPLDDVLGSLALHNNLVAEAARLGQDLEIQRISQVPRIHDRSGRRIGAPETNTAPRPRPKQLGNHAEGMLVINRKLIVLLRPAVALCGEELDVGLPGRQAHGVTAGRALGGGPEWGVGEAVVEAGVGEDAKGEGGEEALLLVLPELVAAGEGVAVVGQVVGCEAGFLGLVEHEDDLRRGKGRLNGESGWWIGGRYRGGGY